ncbi:fungal specific transcription factor domain-containing protein [Phlyctema vagabunda]|uniref:Fungal specific transcription factor domain-containing protein n=1 Tax=Phlyctema vagabunda TaxID=108571 RepID=A0ABR4PJL4_9HELO
MPPERARKITRNRQALSCVTCRQRKVRCGKEHPSCESCLKIGEQCVYGTAATAAAAGAALKEGSGTPSRETEAPSKRPAALIPSPTSSQTLPPNTLPTSPKQKVPVDQSIHGSPNQTQVLLEEAGRLKIQDVPVAKLHGHLSLRDHLRPRYTESTFWGLIEGEEDLCDQVVPQNYTKRRHNCPERSTDDHVEMCVLMASCKDIPPRAICDVLLHIFFVGVQPIYPLIDEVSFLAKYNKFWDWCQQDITTTIPHEDVDNDHTFLVLLFSVIYCAAVTAPQESWLAMFLDDIPKADFVSKLKTLYSSGLIFCKYTRYPTLNTLVALLLAHSCSTLDGEPLDDSQFVGLVLRMAQTLGLHRESAVSHFTEDSEIRRRVWWHIVWLDVHASIMNGLPVNFGGSSGQSDTAMIRSALSNGISKAAMCKIIDLPPPSTEGGNSSFITYTIGRYETAKFEHNLFERLHGTRGLVQSDLDALLSDIRKLHARLSDLIAILPVEGIPERGFMPSKVANATPATHKNLYGDHTNEPTVFTSWARIMLTMFKTESAILLQKTFLGGRFVDKEQSSKVWYRTVQLCLSHLRTYLQIAGTKAFRPYRWFPVTRLPPILPLFVLLIHLRRSPTSPGTKMVRYFVDEIMEGLSKEEIVMADSSLRSNVVILAWTFLKALRSSLDSPASQSLLSSATTNGSDPTSPWQEYSQYSSFPSVTTMPSSNDGSQSRDTTLDISSLEAWSSSIVGADDFFPPMA